MPIRLEEDAQTVAQQIIFQGQLARQAIERHYSTFDYYENPAGIFYTTLVRPREMAKLACVSKAWQKAHKDFLQTAVAAAVPQFFQAALTSGWEMCDLNEYVQYEEQNIRSATRQKHTLWLGDQYVLGVRLSRVRFNRDTESHRFIAQFHAAGQGNVEDDPGDDEWDAVEPHHLFDIPAVCWLDPLFLTAEQVDEKLDWFQQQTAALLLWLEQQRAAAQA